MAATMSALGMTRVMVFSSRCLRVYFLCVYNVASSNES